MNDPVKGKLGSSVSWRLWLGVILIAGTSIVYFVFGKSLSESIGSGWLQLALVSALIVGTLLIIRALHQAGTIDKTFLDYLTLGLALVAIIFAALQFKDSIEQKEKMAFLEKKMEALAQEMSTRFVGTFPKNLEAIQGVVSQASQHLDIMSDHLAYGIYEEPDKVRGYLRLLEDLRSRDIPVQVLVYSRDAESLALGEQFKDVKKEDLSGPNPTLERFVRHFNNNVRPKDKEEFVSLLLRTQKSFMDDLARGGVTIRVTDHELPYYLWLQDDQEAVVVYDLKEQSFRTRDSSLVIDTFRIRFCQLWNNSDYFAPESADWRRKKPENEGRDCKVTSDASPPPLDVQRGPTSNSNANSH
jgi:hypothetical protein